ncbi:MAG: hypothetical protein M1826_001527 [Phylliscum demangeonii]|nr:MAG: hypothetical protein M1826_001527 [Phylliscum demangeonii]
MGVSPLAKPAGEDNKENVTVDVEALAGIKRTAARTERLSKRLRSKSIGPGGLDALTEKAKDRRKTTAGPLIKSILKPTLPLSPLDEIPLYTPSEPAKSPKATRAAPISNEVDGLLSGLLIDISVPEEPAQPYVAVAGGEMLQNPFDATITEQGLAIPPLSPIKQESAATGNTVEQDMREQEKKKILERREARRKSLANRRVSFAPEATLHTWNVVEFVQDSTSSSASTNSTSRASDESTAPQAAVPGVTPMAAGTSDSVDAPSTPPQRPDDVIDRKETVESARDAQSRKRRRRSSIRSSLVGVDAEPDEEVQYSPYSGSSAAGSDESSAEMSIVEEGDSRIGASDSGDGDGDSTSMSLDEVDVTMESVGSAASSQPSTASTDRLDEALRQAAAYAGTQGIDFDENGDLSMEMVGDQVTAAFLPWTKGHKNMGRTVEDLTAYQDQENQNPFALAFQAAIGVDAEAAEEVEALGSDEDAADMDFTRPMGKILLSRLLMQTEAASPRPEVIQQQQQQQQRVSMSPRRASGEGSSLGDATMDLTMAIGVIDDDREAEAVVQSLEPTAGLLSIPDAISAEPAEQTPESKAQPSSPLKSPLHHAPIMERGSSPPEPAAEVKIHLRDFLNMTGIQFMDLTAIKRKNHRASAAKGNEADERTVQASAGQPNRLEDYVVAASCTAPMSDMYQHSCRELKKSIAEGRTIIRQIESDTYAENPGLFQDYVSASPEVRGLLDAQFKNVKTYARLSSKAMWYEWRQKLLDGLQAGLHHIRDDMQADETVLCQQETQLASVLPQLRMDVRTLAHERADLQAHADEVARSNQEELSRARNRLLALKDEAAEKQALLARRRLQIQERQQDLELVVAQRTACSDAIHDAERIREACRGWSAAEVKTWKETADRLERKHGWTIVAVLGTQLTMTFEKVVQLVVDPPLMVDRGRGEPQNVSSPSCLHISYVGAPASGAATVSEPIRAAFMPILNEHAATMIRDRASLRRILAFVADSWRHVQRFADEHLRLSLHFPTDATLLADGLLSLQSTVLLPALGTKLRIHFDAALAVVDEHLTITAAPRATVVYGHRFNAAKMESLLASRTRLEGQEVAVEAAVIDPGVGPSPS